MSSTTAYQYWDGIWKDRDLRSEWEIPSEWTTAVAKAWKAGGVRRVLDLGCGVGRHLMSMHELGFAISGVDKSETACVRAREECAQRGAEIDITTCDFGDLPFPDASFDAVLAYNVVYHGTEADLRACISEVTRVLRQSGRYACTMLSKRNMQYGKGVEIAPNSFVQTDAVDDKVHPHLYCDAADLVRLHAGLKLTSCHDVAQTSEGSFHWYCEFERSAQP